MPINLCVFSFTYAVCTCAYESACVHIYSHVYTSTYIYIFACVSAYSISIYYTLLFGIVRSQVFAYAHTPTYTPSVIICILERLHVLHA